MKDAVPAAIAVTKAINQVVRGDRGRMLAGLIARLGDFQVAEDALQEALISAITHWGRSGVPHSPTGWLMKVALNKGIDRFRASMRDNKKAQELKTLLSLDTHECDPEEIPDERLRLIFACCHPALEEKSRVALTLRTVCNLTTGEIARAFLDQETTMGQRISRAKSKIKSKGIKFSIPSSEQWADRLATVLATIYLIFTAGYVSNDARPRDLCVEALFLMRLLIQLRQDDPEIEGALALILFTQARGPARIDANGATVPIEEQRRALWKHNYILEAQDLLTNALERRVTGPFQIKAAITDCHMADPSPDWQQMSFLYQSLWHHEPTPVIALNWAVVLAELGFVEIALEKLEELQDALSHFQPWYAAYANILEKLGRSQDAVAAYQKAIHLAPNTQNKIFLQQKLKPHLV